MVIQTIAAKYVVASRSVPLLTILLAKLELCPITQRSTTLGPPTFLNAYTIPALEIKGRRVEGRSP
ncbi:hypothetical protein CIT292_08577 [Citrobacter youngae ATCC 29220]|uniref:Uncharacterized protein n=1 Tax=Citrobacter youngae ATCC 29220 TaxID=500640 RepID=D4BDL0_9ENTR|nr:hypothetical protein CIT292_08577 [Citrobacter youngae ATCC 29220]